MASISQMLVISLAMFICLLRFQGCYQLIYKLLEFLAEKMVLSKEPPGNLETLFTKFFSVSIIPNLRVHLRDIEIAD
jgi:hypothetical protein